MALHLLGAMGQQMLELGVNSAPAAKLHWALRFQGSQTDTFVHLKHRLFSTKIKGRRHLQGNVQV